MNDLKLEPFTQNEIIVCDWRVKKDFLVHYRLLNFYVGHGMIVQKVHNMFSLTQDPLLTKYRY